MFRAWGKHQECVCQGWDQNTLQRQQDLRQILVKPKDQDPKEKKSSDIYSYQCRANDCGEEYLGGNFQDPGGTLQNISRNPPLYMQTALTLVINSAQIYST